MKKNMKKLLMTMLAVMLGTSVQAGGLMTNTNYHITFDRMMAPIYSDYTHNQEKYLGTNYAGKDIYSRTNNVIGVGIDYRF